MSADEQQAIEEEFLRLLGLPNRRRRGSGGTLKKSASQFLLSVYKRLMEENNEDHNRVKRSTLSFNDEEERAIEESDVIITFEMTDNHLIGLRHEKARRLWFNISTFPIENTIVDAELRIFQNVNYNHNNTPSDVFVVTAFQFTKSHERKRELVYLADVNTTAGFSGWLTLNVSDALATWAASPNSNNGLHLSVRPVDKPGCEVRPEDIGLIATKADVETQPFIVVFMRSSSTIKTTAPKSKKSQIKSMIRHKKIAYSEVMKRVARQTKENDDSSNCRMKTFQVSFNQLGQFKDWIIEPKKYNASYCEGECKFPLNGQMNATNHAIVQTLVNVRSRGKFPNPCCAASESLSISVLHYSDNLAPEQVMLQTFKKMMVKRCGCQ